MDGNPLRNLAIELKRLRRLDVDTSCAVFVKRSAASFNSRAMPSGASPRTRPVGAARSGRGTLVDRLRGPDVSPLRLGEVLIEAHSHRQLMAVLVEPLLEIRIAGHDGL